jgi:hypothetical protein
VTRLCKPDFTVACRLTNQEYHELTQDLGTMRGIHCARLSLCLFFAIIEYSIKHSAFKKEDRVKKGVEELSTPFRQPIGSHNTRRKPLPSFFPRPNRLNPETPLASLKNDKLLHRSFSALRASSVYSPSPIRQLNFLGGSIGSNALESRRNAVTHACKNQIER